MAAPLALVAGSARTIAMLKGRDGPVWLRAMDLPALWMEDSGRVGRHRPDALAPRIAPRR